MAQRWYLCNSRAPYESAVWQGSWHVTPTNPQDCVLDPVKWGFGTTIRTGSETSATNPRRTGLTKAVSRRLAAQTISGTLDVCIGVNENALDANAYWRIVAYVLIGETDVKRGDLLNYEEASGTGTEFTTTNTGRTLASAQTMSSVVCLEGDHLVVEIGATLYNALTAFKSATIRIGARNESTQIDLSDLTAASTSTSTLAGYVEFSNSITLSATVPTNITPQTATVLGAAPVTVTQDPQFTGYDLWYLFTPGSAVGYTVFAGTAAADQLEPEGPIFWVSSGGVFTTTIPNNTGLVTGESARPLAFANPGVPVYFQINDVQKSTTALTPWDPGTDLVLTIAALPTDSLVDGSLFIPPTTIGAAAPVYAPSDGDLLQSIFGFPATERGAVTWPDNIICVSSKDDPGHVYIWNGETWAQLYDVTTATTSTGQNDPPVTTDKANYFYVAQAEGAGGKVWRLSKTGVVTVAPTTGLPWSLSITAGDVLVGLAVSPDASILYYTLAPAFVSVADTIYRHNLLTDAPLSDLVSGLPNSGATGGTYDLAVLSDGSVLVDLFDVGVTNEIRRYSAAGALLNTYAFTQFSDEGGRTTQTWAVDHFAVMPDDPTSFEVWLQEDLIVNFSRRATFKRIRASDGVLISEFHKDQWVNGLGPEIARGSLPADDLANDGSCPLLVLSVPATTGTIVVVKDAGADTTTAFTFAAGGLSPTSFTLTGGQSRTFDTLTPGNSFTLEETAPAGWAQVGVTVSNGSPVDAISVAAGETVTVTFVNASAIGTEDSCASVTPTIGCWSPSAPSVACAGVDQTPAVDCWTPSTPSVDCAAAHTAVRAGCWTAFTRNVQQIGLSDS